MLTRSVAFADGEVIKDQHDQCCIVKKREAARVPWEAPGVDICHPPPICWPF